MLITTKARGVWLRCADASVSTRKHRRSWLKGQTDHKIWDQEGIFPLDQISMDCGVFYLLCDIEHGPQMLQ